MTEALTAVLIVLLPAWIIVAVHVVGNALQVVQIHVPILQGRDALIVAEDAKTGVVLDVLADVKVAVNLDVATLVKALVIQRALELATLHVLPPVKALAEVHALQWQS